MSKWPLVLLLAFPLSGCGDTKSIKQCAANGVVYFKMIGSYPRLPAEAGSDAGRRAEVVALERCRRSAKAFPDFPNFRDR